MNKRWQAVIFDLDGVLTDTAEYHFRAWKKIADAEGIYFDSLINERLKGIDRINSLEIILENARRQYSSAEKEQLLHTKNEHYLNLISKMTPSDLLPGALETLTALKELGFKLGLASVSKNAGTVITRLQITDYFDYIADATQIKRGKPDPEIFLTVATHLEIEPAKCIGVEDSIAGIKAIKAAGMLAVGVGKPEILNEADLVIADLREFMKVVE
jgi:beta-phosphoglucomutase